MARLHAFPADTALFCNYQHAASRCSCHARTSRLNNASRFGLLPATFDVRSRLSWCLMVPCVQTRPQLCNCVIGSFNKTTGQYRRRSDVLPLSHIDVSISACGARSISQTQRHIVGVFNDVSNGRSRASFRYGGSCNAPSCRGPPQ